MKMGTTRHSLAWLLSVGGLVAVGHVGCDGEDGDGGGAGVAAASCSSCQLAYTEEDCKAWGDLAGCEVAEVTEEDTCKAGIAGCSFTNCKGSPICNDEGSASCTDCKGNLSQADCDAIGEAAGCASATTGTFNCDSKSLTGCDFLGCDFNPSCD